MIPLFSFEQITPSRCTISGRSHALTHLTALDTADRHWSR